MSGSARSLSDPQSDIGPHAGDACSQPIKRVGGAGTQVDVVLAVSAEISASLCLAQSPAKRG
jgi:hypothetical protein